MGRRDLADFRRICILNVQACRHDLACGHAPAALHRELLTWTGLGRCRTSRFRPHSCVRVYQHTRDAKLPVTVCCKNRLNPSRSFASGRVCQRVPKMMTGAHERPAARHSRRLKRLAIFVAGFVAAGVLVGLALTLNSRPAFACESNCLAAYNQCRVATNGSPRCDAQFRACMQRCIRR